MKAPGSEKITLRFPLNKSSLVRSFHSNGFWMLASMRVRVLKVTLGIIAPSLIGVACSGRLGFDRLARVVANLLLLVQGAVNAVAEESNDDAIMRESFISTLLFFVPEGKLLYEKKSDEDFSFHIISFLADEDPLLQPSTDLTRGSVQALTNYVDSYVHAVCKEQ